MKASTPMESRGDNIPDGFVLIFFPTPNPVPILIFIRCDFALDTARGSRTWIRASTIRIDTRALRITADGFATVWTAWINLGAVIRAVTD